MKTEVATMRSRSFLWIAGTLLIAVSGCAPIGDIKDKSRVPVMPLDKNAKIKVAIDKPADNLKPRLEAVLKHIKNRELLTTHSFWTVIHGILANGMDTTLKDRVTGKHVNAVDYICKGGRPRGLEFRIETTGVDVDKGPPFDGQGHQDQFIGELAQCGVEKDREFLIEGNKFTFEDFLQHAKARARIDSDQELSWTLVALSQYYGADFSWKNKRGDALTFEDLVRYELHQPVSIKAACGGTHRLFGLTWAYHIHRKNGGRQTQLWKDVAAVIKKFQERAKATQNGDGTFSTKYFDEPENLRDTDKRIGCTGHIIEWLALSLSDEELKQPWMQEAVHALIRLVLDNESRTLDAGSLYHAAHGLRIYYNRAYHSEKNGSHGAVPPPPKE